MAAVGGTVLEIASDFASAGTLAARRSTATRRSCSSVRATPSNTAVHVPGAAGRPTFANLVDGQTYYVFNPTNSATSYQLAEHPQRHGRADPRHRGPQGTTGRTVRRGERRPRALGLRRRPPVPHRHPGSTVDTQSGPQRIVGPGGVVAGHALAAAGRRRSRPRRPPGPAKGFVGVEGQLDRQRHHERHGDGLHRLGVATTMKVPASATSRQVEILADSATNARATVSNDTGGFVGVGTS